MKIAESAVSLSSSHTAVEATQTRSTFRAWVGERPRDSSGRAPGVAVAVSDAGRRAHAVDRSCEAQVVGDTQAQEGGDVTLRLVCLLVEALTGQKIRVYHAEPVQAESPVLPDPGTHHAEALPVPGRRAGWGMEFDSRTTHVEIEQTAFSAQGMVRTRDGHAIRFDLDLNLSHEQVETSSVSIRAGDAVRKDPLVINLDVPSAQLTDTRFNFDLDVDGAVDHIAFVAPGSGFLALDRNGNGIIDDGSELFGATSGDGFADLSAYDADGNGWIDETDPVFNDLRVWRRDAAGNDTLQTLAETQAGALFLGRVATRFELWNVDGSAPGRLRSSGVWLAEEGGAGTLQQIDLSA